VCVSQNLDIPVLNKKVFELSVLSLARKIPTERIKLFYSYGYFSFFLKINKEMDKQILF